MSVDQSTLQAILSEAEILIQAYRRRDNRLPLLTRHWLNEVKKSEGCIPGAFHSRLEIFICRIAAVEDRLPRAEQSEVPRRSDIRSAWQETCRQAIEETRLMIHTQTQNREKQTEKFTYVLHQMVQLNAVKELPETTNSDSREQWLSQFWLQFIRNTQTMNAAIKLSCHLKGRERLWLLDNVLRSQFRI